MCSVAVVCTKYVKSPVTGCFSIVRHWMFILGRAGSSHQSLFHYWDMLAYQVTTHMVTHNFYPRLPLSHDGYSILFFLPILDAASSPRMPRYYFSSQAVCSCRLYPYFPLARLHLALRVIKLKNNQHFVCPTWGVYRLTFFRALVLFLGAE